MVNKFFVTVGFALILFANVRAFGLNESLERTTSISGQYDARNVFTNPAAMGFQNALNGPEFLGAFGYGLKKSVTDEYSAALGLGYFGIGLEQLSLPDSLHRYSAGLGFPITKYLFAGARYSLVRSNSPDWDKLHSVDLGVQVRPSDYVSFALVANTINRPMINNNQKPMQLIASAMIRPWDFLEFSFDVDTWSNNFANQFGYQAMASVQVFRGCTLRAGYHDQYKFQAGLQFNFGQASVYSAYQSASADKSSLMAGVQVASHVYPSAVQPKVALRLKIDSSIGEGAVRAGLFGKDKPALAEILDLLDRAATEDRVKVVEVKIDRLMLSYAAAQELHEALAKLRNAGKMVKVFLGYASTENYVIASAANEIYLERSGVIAFNGLSSSRYYLKGTLDKIGVEGEFLARGEYKSAPEMFTRKGPSEPSKEETVALIKNAETEIIRLLSQYRKVDRTKWQALMKQALLGPKDAEAAGLIDGIGSFSDEMEKIKEQYVVVDNLQANQDRMVLPPRIAVIVADGDIVDKKIGALSLSGQSMVTPEKIRENFKRALSDSRTEAIVLRISSPGGEILASDEIAAQVEQAAKQKPVIVSMGSVAASGGYFIAAPADRIFADPLTITGSIGVFLGKFNFGPLYKKIDLNKEIITNSPYPGLFSEDRAWSKEERQVLIGQVNQFYDSFVSYVSDKRSMDKTTVDKLARGRVWLGTDAVSNHLVDESGGFLEAVRYAAKKANLEEGKYDRWVIGETRPLFDLFGDADGMITSPIQLLSPEAFRDLHWMSRGAENPFLYLSPVKILN